MYLEVLAPLPGPDTTQFEKTLQAAKEAGAESIRTACLSGRRYETFNTLAEWNTFKADSIQKIERALPIANKHKMPVGIENHKDWTVEEYVAMLKKYSSQYLGVCIDFGNNMSLLDDPMEVVESLAPYVINNHIKDMAVEEYEDGFLLSEVPMGKGMLDLKRMVAVVLKGAAERQILARHADPRPAEDHLPDREVLGDFPGAEWQVPGARAGHGQEEQMAESVAARHWPGPRGPAPHGDGQPQPVRGLRAR